MSLKLVPETVYYIKFHIKIYLQPCVSFVICIIYLESSTKAFLQFDHHIEILDHAVKSSTSGLILSENASWDPGILSCMIYLTYCF